MFYNTLRSEYQNTKTYLYKYFTKGGTTMLLYFIKVVLISLSAVYGVAAASWLMYKVLIKLGVKDNIIP